MIISRTVREIQSPPQNKTALCDTPYIGRRGARSGVLLTIDRSSSAGTDAHPPRLDEDLMSSALYRVALWWGSLSRMGGGAPCGSPKVMPQADTHVIQS